MLFVSPFEPTVRSTGSLPLLASGLFPGPGALEIGNTSEPLSYTADPPRLTSTTGGEVSGIHRAIAANAPWEATARVNVSNLTTENQAAVQASDRDASFVRGPVLGPTSVGGHAGVFAMSREVNTAGWSPFHLELEPNQVGEAGIDRVGARAVQVRLPGGNRLGSAGVGRGVREPVQSTSRTGDWEFVGEYLGPPGTFEATVAQAELNHRLRPVLVHLPINASQWPDPVYTGAYTGFEEDATDG